MRMSEQSKICKENHSGRLHKKVSYAVTIEPKNFDSTADTEKKVFFITALCVYRRKK